MSANADFEQARELWRARRAEHETEEEVITTCPPLPPAPQSIEDTGLSEAFIVDLTLKTLAVRGQITVAELCEALRLPYPTVMQDILRFCKDEMFLEIRRSVDIMESHWELALTSKGEQRAATVARRENYIGPAPVPLAAYNESLVNNPVQWEAVNDDLIRLALYDLVVADHILNAIGPAFNSGKSMFLYGHAGNGKTLISERMAQALKGGMLLPYAVEVGGQVISLYDANYHRIIDRILRETKDSDDDVQVKADYRWLPIERPFIITGGELKLEQLDLNWDPDLKYYVAPVQMKANGGVLMIDDFGRQQASPRDLLNRWIVPLEKNIDYHTLASGQQVEIPFLLLIIFSTNLEPKDLVEEAFLRRIRYKIEIGDPTEEQFREIFRRCCDQFGIPHQEEMVDYLLDRHYRPIGRGLRAVHPRDLLKQLIDIARYHGTQPQLSAELLDQACSTYFVELFD